MKLNTFVTLSSIPAKLEESGVSLESVIAIGAESYNSGVRVHLDDVRQVIKIHGKISFEQYEPEDAYAGRLSVTHNDVQYFGLVEWKDLQEIKEHIAAH